MLSSLLSGFAHLWYIPCILFCYLITPLLQCVWEYISERRLLIDLLIFISCFQIIIVLFFPKFSASWISCYAIAYFLRKLRIEAQNIYIDIIIENLIIVAGFVLSTVRLVCELQGINMIAGSSTLFYYYVKFSKIFFGLAVFLLSYKILDMFNLPTQLTRVLDFSDKYSFEIYIVHQFFILGACSLLNLDIGVIKYVLLIISIITSAFIL